MSRPAQPLDAERELRLLTAAATSFTRSGYELASLNQIIADAGWAKSSFYHYFPDKRRLHDHVVLTLRERIAEELVLPDVGLLAPGTFWPTMTELVAALVRALARHPETRLLERMFLHPPAARGPDGQLTRLRADVAGWLAAAIAAGRRIGEVRDDLPETLLADLALGLIDVLDRWNIAHPTKTLSNPAIAVDLLRDTLGSTPNRVPRSQP